MSIFEINSITMNRKSEIVELNNSPIDFTQIDPVEWAQINEVLNRQRFVESQLIKTNNQINISNPLTKLVSHFNNNDICVINKPRNGQTVSLNSEKRLRRQKNMNQMNSTDTSDNKTSAIQCFKSLPSSSTIGYDTISNEIKTSIVETSISNHRSKQFSITIK
jgi:hypothetical protein